MNLFNIGRQQKHLTIISEPQLTDTNNKSLTAGKLTINGSLFACDYRNHLSVIISCVIQL